MNTHNTDVRGNTYDAEKLLFGVGHQSIISLGTLMIKLFYGVENAMFIYYSSFMYNTNSWLTLIPRHIIYTIVDLIKNNVPRYYHRSSIDVLATQR